jgi:hypothetical protein
MLDFFKRANRTHARSESSPHLRDALANSFFPASSAHQQYDGGHCRNSSLESTQDAPQSFHPHILTQPTFTHRPNFTEPRKPTLDLPPLYTGSDRLPTAARSDQQTQLYDFAVSPEQPPQQFPTKLERTSEPALTGDKIERVKKDHQNRVLSGWFNGESEPISIGIVPSPTKEKSDPLADMSTKPTETTPKPILSTRFSIFGSKASPAIAPSPSEPTDEFSDLDVNTALYPTGPADTFSPASFKNHMQHAEGLLSRLQAAYKERTIALRDMTAEKETQAEELEGAETRSKHLKTQLDDMNAKLAEQDKAMMDLVDDLANEKRLRREEEDARKKSLKLVRPSGMRPLTSCSPEEGFKHQKQRDRMSSATETDCDSEDESCGDSLFSRNHSSSARMSLSSVSTSSSPETSQPPDISGIATAQTARLRQAQPTLVKCQRQPSSGGESLIWSCANCHGGNSSEAWTVVSVLKMENRGLKERVSHVEAALDGCLDVIDRLQ